MNVDFWQTFYPAIRLMWLGQNPYLVDSLFLPPWGLAAFAPFGWIPAPLAGYVWIGLGLIVYLIAFVRMGFHPWHVGALMISPFVFYGLWQGNIIDAFVLLGATLPPVWGVWLVMLKPQTGMVLLILWAWQAQRDGRLLRTFGPLCVACGVCLGLGLGNVADLNTMYWNTALPGAWGIGLAVGGLALWKADKALALCASPLLSPYLAIQSWGGVLLPLRGGWLGAGLVVSWMVIVWKIYSS